MKKKGKFSTNFRTILLPNLRYWQNGDKGSFFLLFESDVRFDISHIIIKTPRFAKYPLRRVLFYAYENDPRIEKKKKR